MGDGACKLVFLRLRITFLTIVSIFLALGVYSIKKSLEPNQYENEDEESTTSSVLLKKIISATGKNGVTF
jgi:hypothetical protein